LLSLVSCRRTFDSFGKPSYLLYHGVLLCQMMAIYMGLLVRTLLVYRITDSTEILTRISLYNAIPVVLFSFFGGVIADRIPKKMVMLWGQVGLTCVTLVVALTLTSGYLSTDNHASWWILAAIAALQGTIMGLMVPSRQAILPEIVGKERLMNAVSLNMIGTSLIRIIAPYIAGTVLLDAFGFKIAYFYMVGLHLLAVPLILLLPNTGTGSSNDSGIFDSSIIGIRYLKHQTTIILILLFTLFATLFVVPYSVLMPFFAEDALGVGAAGLGMLIATSGVGSIIGSIVFASLANRQRGLILLASGLILASTLTGFAFSVSWQLSLSLILFVGIGQSGLLILGNTLIQYYVNDEFRGRVMGIYMMVIGLASFSTLFDSNLYLLVESFGVQWTIGGFAIGLVLISLAALVFVPRVRKLP
jgi:MFS family permease